jgi:hypothetical protein
LKTFESHIIKVPKYKEIFKIISICGIVVLFIIFFIIWVNGYNYDWIFLFFFPFLIMFDFSTYIFKPLKHSVGKLLLTENSILIKDTAYKIVFLEKLIIIINSYKGEVIEKDGDSTKFDGTNNEISFKYNNNKINFNFLIESEFHKNELISLLSVWYVNKIKFLEYNKEGRTYCTKMLNYKEIQEFKKSII